MTLWYLTIEKIHTLAMEVTSWENHEIDYN